MQRLSKVVNKREIEVKEITKKTKTFELKFPNDITILLSKIDTRIFKMISNKIEVNSKTLIFDFNYAFSEILDSIDGIDSMIIKNTRKLYFEALRNVNLIDLTLEAINSFDFSNVTKINVFDLKIKSIEIEIETLDTILKLIKPKFLELTQVKLTNFNLFSMKKFYNRISELKLSQLLISHTSILFEEFCRLIYNSKNIAYASEELLFSFFLLGNNYKSCAILGKNSIVKTLPTEEIEALTVCGEESADYLKNFTNIKFLYIKKVNLELIHVRNLAKNLIKIKLENVNFVDEIGFYEIIENSKNTLRYLEFNNIVLPHDGMDWIKAKCNNCQVIINMYNKFYLN